LSLLHDFFRVDEQHRCPVCGKPDWCLVSRDDPTDPSRVICARVESEKRCGEAGFLHILKEMRTPGRDWTRTRTISVPDVEYIARWHEAAVSQAAEQWVGELGRMLGLTTASLARLGVGVLFPRQLEELQLPGRDMVWTFPMSDAKERVIGLRIRPGRGKKFALSGSRNGLFIPSGIERAMQRLYIAEGESDAAALLDLGVPAVGRAGCTQGTKLLGHLVARLRPRQVVIVADADIAGREGATKPARELCVLVRDVRVIEPPAGIKDAREWKRAGLSVAELEHAWGEAQPWSVRVRSAEGAV
jgi:hypothetical protein